MISFEWWSFSVEYLISEFSHRLVISSRTDLLSAANKNNLVLCRKCKELAELSSVLWLNMNADVFFSVKG